MPPNVASYPQPLATATTVHTPAGVAPVAALNGDSAGHRNLSRNSSSDSATAKFWTPGWEARLHDDVNLFVLAAMATTSAWAMWLESHALQYGLTCFATGYMLLDAAWIGLHLNSVKSARTVLGHHAATLTVLLDPLLQPHHSFYTACALLVEFNTFLLILRRRVSWGGLLEIPFALSWVALRLVWFPFLALYFAMCGLPAQLEPVYPQALVDWRRQVEGDNASPMYLAATAAWFGICIFQFWWSCALYRNYQRALSPSNGKGSRTASKKYL